MIEITTIDRALVGQFDNFNDLFDAITNIENSASKNSEFSQMNWRFVIHTPQEVAGLYPHSKGPSETMKEAFEEHLPLIEICTGDYKKPLYIVMTAYVDIVYLKKKWCIDWCIWHHLVVREINLL